MRWLLAASLLAGCGNVKDDSKHDAATGSPDSPAIDSKPPTDAAIDMMTIDAPPGTYPLTVKNVISWCSVTINGGAASAASSQTVFVLPAQITLTATPVTGFILGPNMWHHTDNDTGTGDSGVISGDPELGVSTAKATVGMAAKCVWVCCPFPNGSGCNVADQCP